MNYQIGDKVIHWTYGPGEIVRMDEKRLSGKTCLYYVVELNDLTIWVPVDESGEKSIHPPTSRAKFQRLLDILVTPGAVLPDDRNQRQAHLTQQLRAKSLEDICRLIRDLVSRSATQPLNRNDSEMLKRAEDLLLNEWELSLGASRETAQLKLKSILSEDTAST